MNRIKKQPLIAEYKNERSKKFYKTAESMSDYISTLSLTEAQIKKLVDLIASHINEAENGAYIRGIQIGSQYTMQELEKSLNKGSRRG